MGMRYRPSAKIALAGSSGTAVLPIMIYLEFHIRRRGAKMRALPPYQIRIHMGSL
jgi:hypothetical protein